MPTATMTSKGQTTIPAEVRRRLRLEPGDRLDFIEVAEGRYELRPAHGSLRDLKGFLAAWASPPVSDDDAIMAALAQDDR